MKEDSSAGEHPENAVVGGSTPPLLFFKKGGNDGSKQGQKKD